MIGPNLDLLSIIAQVKLPHLIDLQEIGIYKFNI